VANEIFISYRRTDEPRARQFYNLLRERGVEAWYDAKIEAGEDWRTTTANALDAAPIFVLLLSRTATESSDIAKELAAATHKRKLVVPVRLDDMQLEGMFLYELASRNWIDAYKNTEKKLAELADQLAALVKAGVSAEAAQKLGGDLSQLTEANVAAAAAPRKKAMGFGGMQRSGSVALLTAGAVGLVAVVGGGGWWLSQPSGGAEASSVAVSGEMVAGQTVAGVAGSQTAPDASLAALMTELASTAGAAGRSESEIAALTEAAAKLADAATPAEAQGEIALAAARAHVEALAADPVVAAVRNDFRTAKSDSGRNLTAEASKGIEDSNAAQAALKTAAETVAGTDAAAAMAAAKSAQDAIVTLIALRPVASEAFLAGKRHAYALNSAAARSAAGEIAQLRAAAKKPGVFASKDRREAHEYIVSTDTWARERMGALDVVASSVASADRRAATKHASDSASARAEIETALGHVRNSAATLQD
jgi:hypothetical protein